MKRFFVYAGVILIGLFLGKALRTVWIAPAPPSSEGHANIGSSLLGERGKTSDQSQVADGSGSRAERVLAVAHRAETASGAQLARLVDAAEGELKEALGVRWAKVDPVGMLESFPEYGGVDRLLVQILFDEWMASDPEKAMEYLSDPRHARWSSYAVWGAMKTDPMLGFEVVRQFKRHNLHVPKEAIRDWVPQDPRAAATLLASIPSNRVMHDAMTRVGEAWADQAPREALVFAKELSPGLRKVLTESTMKRWCVRDLDSALAYAEAQAEPSFLKGGIVLGLGQEDPQAALDFAQEHLQSKARADAVANVVTQLAEKDHHEAAKLLASLPVGGGLNQAVETYVQLRRLREPAERDEILTLIDGLPDTVSKRRAIAAFEWNLESIRKHGLADFVSGPYGHLALAKQVRTAAMQRARQDRPSALAWAQSLPEDRQRIAIKAVKQEQSR